MYTICVCGAGTMGSGIAQVAAQAGFSTILFDLEQAALEKARASISASLQIFADKKKITLEDKQRAESNLRFEHTIENCKGDIIIEAIIEKPDAKLALFTSLAAINSPDTILATNTSSLSVTQLAENISNPERVIGLHFFNPAPLMKLVEVVKTPYSSEKNIHSAYQFAVNLGKTPVLCMDFPGFIVNHVARSFYIEALRLVEEGKADFEMIDQLMESAGFKMGPFRLMDLIGNDVNYAVSCSVYEALGKPERLLPSYIQEQKVKHGELGRKSGSGYYKY